jgi:Mor family transcriptional regulator
MKHKTEARNREIFAEYKGGGSPKEIARIYGLSPLTVIQIIMIEKHKQAVSPDDFYKTLRLSSSH